MSDKIAAKGVVFEHGGAASGAASWSTIDAHRLDGIPGDTADEIDVTTHDSASGRKEFLNGLVDSEDLSCELIYDAADAVHEALRVAAGGVAQHFRITLPTVASNNTHTFTANVKSFVIGAAYDGEQKASMTLKRTGADAVTSV